MGKRIMVPFSRIVIMHREIGIHRGRKYGFRDVFGFRSLQDLPFTRLASKVKDAYEGRAVPSHKGWPDQREALRWLVDKGRDEIIAMNDDKPIKLRPAHYDHDYYIEDGHHRLLALFIFGDSEVQAKIKD